MFGRPSCPASRNLVARDGETPPVGPTPASPPSRADACEPRLILPAFRSGGVAGTQAFILDSSSMGMRSAWALGSENASGVGSTAPCPPPDGLAPERTAIERVHAPTVDA